MKILPHQQDLVFAHFQRMLSLAERLRNLDTDIHAHEYNPHFSESWKIIAGSYRHRFQFQWEGHVRVLIIREAFFDILGSWEGDWKELRTIHLDSNTGGDPFKQVEDFFSHRQSSVPENKS